MGDIYNRCFFILIGLTFHYFYQYDYNIVIPFLLAVILSSLWNVFPKNTYVKWLSYGWMLLSMQFLVYLFYIPMLLYQEYEPKTRKISYVLLGICYFFSFSQLPFFIVFLSSFFCVFAIIMKHHETEKEALQKAYVKQRDDSKELANLLEERNQDLLLKQDYEIKIATLDERNRIAREIHDNVGHLLSSSLLQVGALQTINQNSQLNDSLQTLRETISAAMDNVRSSVHDLHDDAIDLEAVLKKLINSYSFCPVVLEYVIIHPLPQTAIYQLCAIIKESMHNTMKHSNATRLQIMIREQHDFYQIILHDNGMNIMLNHNGIGLKNIQDRVASLQGYVNFNTSEGFQIFITLPKEIRK